MVSGDYVQTDDNNVDAVIFAKCDLTLNGTGSLTVKDNTGHGIVSKDDLVVTGGTYTIYSQDHCLNGKDSVRIADGTFNLSCDEDGIHAGNDDQQDGYVYIEGGDINISVGDDAIHAEGLLIITGGDIEYHIKNKLPIAKAKGDKSEKESVNFFVSILEDMREAEKIAEKFVVKADES